MLDHVYPDRFSGTTGKTFWRDLLVEGLVPLTKGPLSAERENLLSMRQ